MSLLKRVFSADYRRALAAEAAGEYVEAARAYALAGERVKVAEMHLLASERATGLDGRLTELRTAARWADGESPDARSVRRRIARALLDQVRAGGLLTDVDRKLLRETAQLFASAGDDAGAGECLELAGDEQGAADAYQHAGEVERLESVLSRDEDRRAHALRLREAFTQHELDLKSGARDAALDRLRECVELEPSGPSRKRLAELERKRLASGTALLRVGPAREPTLYVGVFPFGIGREAAADVALRDPRLSRRHAEILSEAGRFLVRDCRSRNGTLLGGVRLSEGASLPLAGEGEIGLGDAITLAFRVDGTEIALRVIRGADRGVQVVASPRA